VKSPRNWAAAALALLGLGCVAGGRPSVPGVTVEFEVRAGAANHPSIVARWPGRRPKLPPGQLLAVRLPGQRPLLGAFESTDRSVTFTPSFPLLAGQRHEAAVLPNGPSVFYTPATPASARPRLAAIHPATDALPANHLKFYLLFTEPMEQGAITRHFKLLDANGRAVPEPFRDTELWSGDGRRLTLWFHPGRQKTGVNLNLDLGPVLMAGGRYTLVVDGRWKSQAGRPLGVPIKKTFRALAGDRARPDPSRWRVDAPRAGTRQPLRVRFDEPLDWALLHTQLAVTGIAGQAAVDEAGRAWNFTPDAPWPRGGHELIVGWELEDLAGNNLKSLFEVDLTKSAQPGRAVPARIAFTVN
jgi:hypothetical protein